MSGTFVGMPAFPTAAREALGDTQLRRNLAHATRTIRDKRAAVVAEVEDWEELRVAGAAVKEAALRDLATHLETLEASLTRAGATVHWARDAEEACAIVAAVAHAHGVDEVVKVKSMATAEIGLNEALEAEGIAAWETDLAELIVQLGDDLPSHILVPAIHRNRAEIREIFRRRMGDVGRPAPDDLTDEPAVLAGAARAAPAREVPARQGRRQRRQLRRRRHRHARRGRVRGQRPDVPDPARGAGQRRRHREGRRHLVRPRPDAAAAAALVDGGADEPLHLDLVRRDARRRPAGGARRAARQRPHPRARRRRRPPGAALHPLLGLPQRLPGLRAGRRPRLRLGLPRPDRRDPQPAAQRRRRRADRVPAVRLVAVRRVLRGLPGPHRHPVGAGRPARRRRRLAPRRPRAEARGGRDEGRRVDVLRLRAGSRGPSAPPGWPAASSAASPVRRCPAAAPPRAACPGPPPAGPAPATCPPRRRSPSATGGTAPTGAARTTSLASPAPLLRRTTPRDPETSAATRSSGVSARPCPACRPRWTSLRPLGPPTAATWSRCSSSASRTTGRSSPGAPPDDLGAVVAEVLGVGVAASYLPGSASTSPARSWTTA